MLRRSSVNFLSVIIWLCLIGHFFGSSFAKEKPLPEVYQQRRAQVLSELDSGSVAIFYSGDRKMRAADVPFPFRVDNNFYYLSGCEIPRSILLLIADGVMVNDAVYHELLFIPPSSQSRTGHASDSREHRRGFPGFSLVLPLEQFADYRDRILTNCKILYYTDWPATGFIYDILSENKYFLENEGKKALKKKYPKLQIRSLSQKMAKMRVIKSPPELQLMQRAIDITCESFVEAARAARANQYEYELQAVIEYHFRRNGAMANAFPCIIGSGPNSLILHYDENQRQMRDGEVVVIDIGAEYQNYCADLTRTIPVNGKFSAAQRQIYEIVLRANEALIAAVKPGVTIAELDKLAQSVVADGLLAIGLIKERGEARRFLPHGVSHPLGLQAHDVGTGEPLAPGFVITIEPGIYIPAEEGIDAQYWNIGIRIEDDVLVTETGCRVLTERAPKKMAEIEKLMGAKKLR